jgi:hypothetical protein
LGGGKQHPEHGAPGGKNLAYLIDVNGMDAEFRENNGFFS